MEKNLKYIQNEKGLLIPTQCGTCMNWCRMMVTNEKGKKEEMPMCIEKNVVAYTHDGRKCKAYQMSVQYANMGGQPGNIKKKSYIEWLTKKMLHDAVAMPKPQEPFDEVKNALRLNKYRHEYIAETGEDSIYTYNPLKRKAE